MLLDQLNLLPSATVADPWWSISLLRCCWLSLLSFCFTEEKREEGFASWLSEGVGEGSGEEGRGKSEEGGDGEMSWICVGSLSESR